MTHKGVPRKKGRVGRVGDVFLIPLDNERVGIGQIIAMYRGNDSHLYFAMFSRAYSRRHLPQLPEAVQDEMAFLALSLDGQIWRGEWEIIGNVPVDPASFPLPAWKEFHYPNTTYVMDYTGSLKKQIDPAEAESLPNEKVVAPARLENALRALHGIGPWEERYEALRPRPKGLLSSDFFPDQNQTPGADSGITDLDGRRGFDAAEPEPARWAETLKAGPPHDSGLGDLDQSKSEQLDHLTLKELEGTGADLNNPRHTIHYLSFGRKSSARAAQKTLLSDGYEVEIQKAQPGAWLVMASRVAVVDPSTTRETRTQMERLAVSLGGEYDGWEAQTD